MIWARDFFPKQVAEVPEYFVYFGAYARKSWEERSDQIAKGVFFEVPIKQKTANLGETPTFTAKGNM